MNGNLSSEIVILFKNKFHDNCINLLLEAYQLLIQSGKKINEDTENNITVQLVGYMKKNPKRAEMQIHLDRESYLDSSSTFDGFGDADKSPRIDIKYSTWNSNNEVDYFMEAKNLAESDWQRTGSGTTVNAKKLQKRYLTSGVSNFTTGRYPEGCLIGYIVQGTTYSIVELINQELIIANRTEEVLNPMTGYGIDFCFISCHSGTSIAQLKHFFLNLV